MTDSIEQQLRAHLKRKLKIIHGHGQITVRRLVTSIRPRVGDGLKHTDEKTRKNLQYLNRKAALICEEAGGTLDSHGWSRVGSRKDVASRVYQF